MIEMNKPIFNGSFSVDDIHKLREYHYETTKNLSAKEFIDDINKRAEEFKKKLKKAKKEKIAM